MTITIARNNGHAAILADGKVNTVLADYGPILRLYQWGNTSLYLTPTKARELAAILTEWADMQDDEPEPENPDVDEADVYRLFEVGS